MQNTVRACIALLLVCLMAGAASGQDRTGAAAERGVEKIDEARIRKLIEQLGADQWRVREQATRALAEIGPAALPALRKAMLSDDLEVSARARMIYRGLVGVAPDRLHEFRGQVHEAFGAGDYRRMMKLAERVTASKGANLVDWLWLGHAGQLAGNWQQAVTAYKKVVHLLGADFMMIPDGGKLSGAGWRNLVREMVARPVNPRQRKKLLGQRTNLARWVARIQSGPLKDPKAAAVTLAEAAGFLDAADLKVSYAIRLPVLKELAAAQHAGGDLQGAFRTWAKLYQQCHEVKHGPVLWYLDIERIGRALAELPTGKPVPEIPPIFVLTPNRPLEKLMLNDPQTLRRAYTPCQYAFAPAPGKEFATIEFACDLEQLEHGYGGQFTSYVKAGGHRLARKTLADIRWSRDKRLGREVIKRKANVPRGVKLVHVKAGSWKGKFKVHSVRVKATFRPVTKNPPPIQASGRAQMELLPKGGRLTCGARTLRDRTATDIAPGRYVLRYHVPGRKDTFEADFLVAPGRRYGIFVNLDSPFKWVQAGPTGLYSHTSGRASISRLPDGSYMAAWCGPGSKIMLSRTSDLVKWTTPESAPFNSIFENIAPATITARDGTVHLAYFSRRLSLRDSSTQGYRLFLTSTRDGRKWTPLKPVSIGRVVGSGRGGIHLFRGPDGKYRIFWSNYAAAAKSIGNVTELQPIRMEKPTPRYLFNPYVTADAKGLFQMVFDGFEEGVQAIPAVYHSTSRDGRNWTAPAQLVKGRPGDNHANPQLILAKGKALLIYENRGAYMIPVRFNAVPVASGEGLKIVGGVMMLHGGRATLTKDGEVLLLAGTDTSWLLRARLKGLLDIKIGK